MDGVNATDVDEFLNGQTPMQIFSQWFENAKAQNMRHPEAFVLATLPLKTTQMCSPDTRVVLMKEHTSDGIIFYTNYQSQKAEEIDTCANATAHFYWDPLFLQVKMMGTLTKTSRQKSEAYWNTRPRLSQLAQWVSKQSQPVANRKIMEAQLSLAEEEFKGKNIPCPQHWGGYLITPTYIEFWIGRDGRFHDRYTYLKVENNWIGQRLYP